MRVIALLVLVTSLTAPATHAREVLVRGDAAIAFWGGPATCSETVLVALEGSADTFSGAAVPAQLLAGNARFVVEMSCPEVQEIAILGTVPGQGVAFQARSRRADDWRIRAQDLSALPANAAPGHASAPTDTPPKSYSRATPSDASVGQTLSANAGADLIPLAEVPTLAVTQANAFLVVSDDPLDIYGRTRPLPILHLVLASNGVNDPVAGREIQADILAKVANAYAQTVYSYTGQYVSSIVRVHRSVGASRTGSISQKIENVNEGAGTALILASDAKAAGYAFPESKHHYLLAHNTLRQVRPVLDGEGQLQVKDEVAWIRFRGTGTHSIRQAMESPSGFPHLWAVRDFGRQPKAVVGFVASRVGRVRDSGWLELQGFGMNSFIRAATQDGLVAWHLNYFNPVQPFTDIAFDGSFRLINYEGNAVDIDTPPYPINYEESHSYEPENWLNSMAFQNNIATGGECGLAGQAVFAGDVEGLAKRVVIEQHDPAALKLMLERPSGPPGRIAIVPATTTFREKVSLGTLVWSDARLAGRAIQQVGDCSQFRLLE